MDPNIVEADPKRGSNNAHAARASAWSPLVAVAHNVGR
jgi:hypothetical protein